jgi:nucleotide-binding universal stress UspA family protein
MSVTVTNKLSNSFEGALAAGGDASTSPLYIFGPFLKLIVLAGVAQITFGATVWMAVASVVVVAAMYRQVMRWVTDGSGGSGLTEEEFGSWAVKINASISFIEYVLTFLVSMAALVTFVADRFSVFNNDFFGVQYRDVLAVILGVFTCYIVNLGPKVSARAFGPAMIALLILLWGMIISTIYQLGFHLPEFNLEAFSLKEVTFIEDNVTHETTYLGVTLAGYARVLTLMTGIEVFANLVAAYDGKRAEKSKKAFGSLVIVMATTTLTMLIVGTAILNHTDPLNTHISVFTQMMDFLFPPIVSYIGTIIGIVVLLSSCAAAALAIQNLALGLRYRHYIAAQLGERNKHDVADKPIWIMCGIVSICCLFFGTKEETYLALYAAGVFIILSMTGWAATKRLLREIKKEKNYKKSILLIGTIGASIVTTFATIIIFEERFFDGVWAYVIMIPVFYCIFAYYRKHLGPPPSFENRLGLVTSGKGYVAQMFYNKTQYDIVFNKIIVPLSGNMICEQILPIAHSFARAYYSQIDLLMISDLEKDDINDDVAYLRHIARTLSDDDLSISYALRTGETIAEIDKYALEVKADLIVMTVSDYSMSEKIFSENTVNAFIRKTSKPTLVIRADDNWRSRHSRFKNILVALDGSEESEAILPYIRTIAERFGSKVLLLSVPEGSESEEYTQKIENYLDGVAVRLRKSGIPVRTLFTGSGPARTIIAVSTEEKIDLIMMASQGRGGETRDKDYLGSVTDRVLQETPCPMFIVH